MQTLREQRLIDEKLHHDQLVFGNARNPRNKRFEAPVEFAEWSGLDRQPPRGRFHAGQTVTGEQKPFRALDPDAVRPQRGGG